MINYSAEEYSEVRKTTWDLLDGLTERRIDGVGRYQVYKALPQYKSETIDSYLEIMGEIGEVRLLGGSIIDLKVIKNLLHYM